MTHGLLAALLLCTAAPALADVAPPTPLYRAQMAMRLQLEEQARAGLGLEAVEKVLHSRSWVLTAPAGSPRVILLVKEAEGWFRLLPRGREPAAPALADALDQALADPALWTEQAFSLDRPCNQGESRLVVRRGGRELIARPCGAEGPSAALANLAWPRPVPVAQVRNFDQAGHGKVQERTGEMAASWERGDLAGFVEPYAEDAVIIRADGLLEGKQALIERLRAARRWEYGATPPVQLQEVRTWPIGEDVIGQARLLRWQASRPMEKWVSAIWRRRGGLWEIVQEHEGAARPAPSAHQSSAGFD